MLYEIDEQKRSELRDRLPEVVAHYINIPAQRGRRKYKVCCPLHNERTPSCEIDTEKQVFYCFGCKKTGDVFSLVAEKEGIDLTTPEGFHLVAKIIADIGGVALRPRGKASTATKQTPPQKPTKAQQSKNRPQPDRYIIPREIVTLRASGIRSTGLFSWLVAEFGEAEAVAALERYRVGAANNGTTPEGMRPAAFPYINTRGECIDMKIFHIDPTTGSRKTAPALSSWIDKATGEQRESRSSWAIAEINMAFCRGQCTAQPKTKRYKNCPEWDCCTMRKHRGQWAYFGEHLLADLPEGSRVAVVESEKTALVASIVYPEFTWVATGSQSNLNLERMKPLRGFSITIFPDRDAKENWGARAGELANEGYDIELDITLHAYAGGPHDDICDIILRQRHGELSRKPQPPEEPEASTPPTDEAVPWRLRVPEPDKESEPEAWRGWIADRVAWRLELKEQCRSCCYSKIMFDEVKGCRLSIADEEAASTKICKGYEKRD